MKSACNKSCRSSHKDSRKVEFAFLRFFCDLLLILQVCCFSKQKKKETKLRSWAPGRLKQIAGRPLAGVGIEEAAGGQNPSEELAGSEG